MRLDFIAIWLEALSNSFHSTGKKIGPVDKCLNCQYSVSEDEKYCPSCGQKLTFSTLTIWTLLGEFFENLFNLDNSVFRTIRKLPYPGYLAREYMAGRRKKYINPVRFFFVTLIFLFAIISLISDLDELDRFSDQETKNIRASELKQEYLNWKDSLNLVNQDNCAIDTLEHRLFENIQVPDKDTMSNNMTIATVDMGKYKFLRRDLYEMDMDTLLSRYEVTGFRDKLIVRQYARGMRDITGAIQFFIGNMIWGIVTTTFLIGFFLKLLYIRRNRYYVEHVVLVFNIHSFALILIAFVLLVTDKVDQELGERILKISSLAGIIYSYLSFKFYYQQGWVKTFIKFAMSLFAYFMIMIMMLGIVFLASLLLFK